MENSKTVLFPLAVLITIVMAFYIVAGDEINFWPTSQARPEPVVTAQAAAPSTPAPKRYIPVFTESAPETSMPELGAEEKEALSARIVASMRAAVAKFPALTDASQEIYIRFNYRYGLLAAANSARLQEPDWPMRLADECDVACKEKLPPAVMAATKASLQKHVATAAAVRPRASASASPVISAPAPMLGMAMAEKPSAWTPAEKKLIMTLPTGNSITFENAAKKLPSQ